MIPEEIAFCKVKNNDDKIPLDGNPVNLKITENFMAESFGAWLRSQRERAGLNQSELARRSRVTKTTISMYEADKITQPRLAQLDKIARVLNLSTDEVRKRAAGSLEQSEVDKLAAELARSVLASGYDDLEDPALREAFLEDMKSIAESMLKRKLEEQAKKR